MTPRESRAAQSASPFACVTDRVFDGERVLQSHAVVVEGSLVVDVVPLSAVPDSMPVLREPGCTLIPGLIDVHVHFLRWEGPQFLAYGVTTIRDTGNELAWVLARQEEWPRHLWPRIMCQGPLLDGPTPLHSLVARACGDEARAVAAVRDTAAAGVDGIKLYTGLDRTWLPAMVRATHETGLRASIHCGTSGPVVAAEAGVDEFFHLDGVLHDVWPDHPPGWLELWGAPGFAQTADRQREVADTVAASGMVTTPTLAYWDSQSQIRAPGYTQSAALSGVPAALVRWQCPERPDASGAEQWRRALEAAQGFVGLLLERQAPLLAGSDTPCGPVPPGLSLWRELELLTEAGMSPEQALRAATSDAAAFLGRPELGRLRPGAQADMVFVRGNPAERIEECPGVVAVLRGGTTYRPAELLAASLADDAMLDEGEPWSRQFEAHWQRAHPGV